MRKSNRGISLLEVIVVIGIIIVLIGLIMPATSIVRRNSTGTETSAEMAQLDTALIAFFTDNGCFPKPGQMLASLSNNYFNFDTKRVEGTSYSDKWGVPYLYLCPSIISAKGYDLFSLGLLKSQGDGSALEGIIKALYSSVTSSSNSSETKTPPGLSGADIWGLTKPQYDIIILGALSLLRSTDTGFNLAIMINISNLPIYRTNLGRSMDPELDTGVSALYYPYDPGRGIYIDISFSNGPAEAIAAIIAHEATHLADNLATGDTDFDSIAEEYDAYYNEAMVWEELIKGKTFENLENAEFVENNPFYKRNITEQDENLAMIEKGEEEVKRELRLRYPNIPEEDQWGDSYVVAKEY